MNKTLTYVLIVIGAYLLIIFPKINSKKEEKAEKKTETKKKENESIIEKHTDEHGIARGAGGRLKYQIGHTH